MLLSSITRLFGPADVDDIPTRLDRALARHGAGGKPVQLVCDFHVGASYHRWRKRQLQRMPGAFVPALDLREGYAVVAWAVRPGALSDFLRRGRTKALVSAPTVSHFHSSAHPELAVAAAVAQWAEETDAPRRSLRSGRRIRVP
jgi:hypothetical protein